MGNLSDAYARSHGGEPWGAWEDWDDGNTCHAAVGSYAANPFGLHDVVGNVGEWCRDGYSGKFYPAGEARDPVTDPALWPNRVARGGSFNVPAIHARSWQRSGDTPENEDFDLGLRPARHITP